MEWISSWAGQIIVAVVIATLFEMILPEGKNKKYIKMVIGLYVVFTIISPIVSKASQSDWNEITQKYQEYFNVPETDSQTATMEAQYDKNIQTAYEQGMKQDMKERLKEKGYQVEKINLEFTTENKDSYGTIEKIEIKITGKEKQEETNTIAKIEPVNKIEIGTQAEEKENTYSLTESEKREIKELFETVYAIQQNQIVFLE